MAVPAWFWPPSGMSARGNALLPFGANIVVPDWTTPSLWTFNTTVITPPIVLATGTLGLSAAAPTTSGGIWATAYQNTLWEIPPTGPATAHSLTAGELYIGCAVASSTGFALNSSGVVRNASNGVVGTFGAPGISLGASGTTLFSPIPSLSGIGTMAAGTGVTGLIALPAGMLTPTCIAVATSSTLLVGGYIGSTALSGMTDAALNPADTTHMLAVGSGHALLWGTTRGAQSDQWAQTQLVTGTANLNSVAWTPNATQALATSVVSGSLQVFNNVVGVLSLAQTLPVPGAIAVAFGSNVDALVVQSGTAHVALVSASGGVWTLGTTIGGLTGAVAAVTYAPSNVAVSFSGGIGLMTLVTSGIWTTPTIVPLGFSPLALAADTFGQTYAAGSGFMAVVAGGIVVGTGTLPPGTPTDIVVQQGYAIIAMPSVSAITVMGLTSPGTWTQQFSGALTLGAAVRLGLSQTTLFVMGSGATAMYGFSGAPYVLTPVLAGAVGQWNGSAWAMTVMGPSFTPAAVGFGAGTTAWVATTQNDLWSMTSGGAVLTQGFVTQQSGQAQSVPLGASDILFTSGQVFVSTSVAGMLIEAA